MPQRQDLFRAFRWYNKGKKTLKSDIPTKLNLSSSIVSDKKFNFFFQILDKPTKVWICKDKGKGGSVLRLAQEIREHTKAVTSLTVVPSGNTLYSGSHDKTIRVRNYCYDLDLKI